jgi:hypothetical protein
MNGAVRRRRTKIGFQARRWRLRLYAQLEQHNGWVALKLTDERHATEERGLPTSAVQIADDPEAATPLAAGVAGVIAMDVAPAFDAAQPTRGEQMLGPIAGSFERADVHLAAAT